MQPTRREATTDQHQLKSQFNASIRANYQSSTTSALAFSVIAIGVALITLMPYVDASRIVGWATLHATIMMLFGLATRLASPRWFLTTAVAAEATSSVGWSLLPAVALATRSDWQVAQGLLLIAVVMATLGRSTASRSLHLASTVPIALLATTFFTLYGDGAARWLGAAFAIAVPSTLSAGAGLRQVQRDLFESSLRNEMFAESLHAEGERLKAANTHLDEQSRRDPLTGLYNRAGFLHLLNQVVADRADRIAVCYIDLDGFKRVNDAFGHRFGDLVLCAASQRLSGILQPGEVLARQGGDELTLFGALEDMEQVDAMGSRIMGVFDDPFLIEGRRIEIGVSAGLVWVPDYTSADDLMRFADTALYKAKELGRRQFSIFDEEMRAELASRNELQVDLGMAFERAEITPYLQPIVNVHTGKIASAEALARWHNDGEVRDAHTFVDTARDLGVLDRINDTVVQQVFDFQRTLSNAQHPLCPITLNVSPIHFEAMLNHVLAEPPASPIVIEITEDGIFSDIERANTLLNRARAAGIKILLDDFGVGFSSLSIATELPIDGFKIDRAFVASLAGNPSAVAAVQSIVQLAQRMDLHVVAEGVETHEQLDLLRDLGVGFAQGYLFSKAVPMPTFADWIQSDFHFDVSPPLASALSATNFEATAVHN